MRKSGGLQETGFTEEGGYIKNAARNISVSLASPGTSHRQQALRVPLMTLQASGTFLLNPVLVGISKHHVEEEKRSPFFTRLPIVKEVCG